MPLYEYFCKNCNERFDDFRTVDKRHSAKCEKCNKMAKKVLSVVRIDYAGMGVSPDFPTAWDKWDKTHRKEAKREYD